MSAKGKAPAFQFYPADWLRDPELRRCSAAARGVWIDMICLAFACDAPGTFASNGSPWEIDEIARSLQGDYAENLTAIRELLAKGVASIDATGAVFCRRMRRDTELRRTRAEAGRFGGLASGEKRAQTGEAKRSKRKQTGQQNASKPAERKPEVPQEVTANDAEQTRSKREAKRRSSSSSSSSTSVCKPPLTPPEEGKVVSVADQVVALYEAYPKHIARDAALKAIGNALRKPGVTFDLLLEAVQEYARSRKGQDPNLTPYPASWFNAGRWADDRAEWFRGDGATSRAGPGKSEPSGRPSVEPVKAEDPAEAHRRWEAERKRRGLAVDPGQGRLRIVVNE